MKIAPFSILCCAFLAGTGCATKQQSKLGSATVQGAPKSAVPVEIIFAANEAQGFDVAARGGKPGQHGGIPQAFTIPGTYRAMLVDGKMVMVREADPRPVRAPDFIRVASGGDVSLGNPAYQPALLDSELATEVVQLRFAQAQADETQARYIRQAQQLAEQSVALQEQYARTTAKLVETLAENERLRTQGGTSAAPASIAGGVEK